MSFALLLKSLLASGILTPVVNAGTALVKKAVGGLTGWKATLAQAGVAAAGGALATWTGFNPLGTDPIAATALAGAAVAGSNVTYSAWKAQK